MRIYFAGIGGMAIGPLAQIAKAAGHEVAGSDLAASTMTKDLNKQDIPVVIGSGDDIAAWHTQKPIDWIVVSAAIPTDSPIVTFAKKHRIKLTKRDELINKILCGDKKQTLVAVAGTHGKSTTTAMLIWLFKEFDIPISYSVGTLLGFGPSGYYADGAEYFIYEADEYDRNMLQFKPSHTLLPSVDYDHPDTYPTVEDYKQAFRQFIAQSNHVYLWQKEADYLQVKPNKHVSVVDSLMRHSKSLTLPGIVTRNNALLAASCFDRLCPEFGLEQIIAALNRFPGTWRRFEKLATRIYTTYAHHPTEIAANLQMASELSKKIVVVYQPHQNIRQHELLHAYKDCFVRAQHVYWLPTYLTREDPKLAVLTPQDLIAQLADHSIAEPAKLDTELLDNLKKAHAKGAFVLVMGAGDVDDWLRRHLRQLAA